MRYKGWGQRPRATTSPKWSAASRSTRSGLRRRCRVTPTQGVPRGPGTTGRDGALLGLLVDPCMPRRPRSPLVTGGSGFTWPPECNAHRNAVLCRVPPRCLALVEPAVELDDDAVRIVDIETAHPALGIGERCPWASKLGAFRQQCFQQGLRVRYGKGKVRNTHLVQL